jgi:four helix bundle protein
MGPTSVRNLEIWREGIQLVNAVYKLTKAWPKEELFGLTSQVRRAAISISANIAEGVGRASAGDTARFAQIALGSAYELDTLLEIAAELALATPESISPIQSKLNQQCRQISGFIRYQESGPKPGGKTSKTRAVGGSNV